MNQATKKRAAEWHGYSVGKKALHVGHLPGRSSVALYVVERGTSRVLAYFRSEDAAQEALAMLTLIAVSLFGGDHRDDA